AGAFASSAMSASQPGSFRRRATITLESRIIRLRTRNRVALLPPLSRGVYPVDPPESSAIHPLPGTLTNAPSCLGGHRQLGADAALPVLRERLPSCSRR